jgi:lipopolysaccharide export system ATP-binding protein
MVSTLSAAQLRKHYNKRAVVNDVSLEVKTGEVVGLLGPNGAGKTTSFYMLVGLIKVDSGEIMLDSRSITYTPMHVRATHGIGYLPQEPSVFKKLSVADNLRAVLQLRTEINALQREDSITALLDEFHISHLKNQKAGSLSGGERRRVEIARALASNPKFILLDEPFAGIDPISVEDIKKIIQHLTQRGIGVLITEHNVRETLDICHRAYILSEGQVIAQGDTQAIINNEKVRNVYLGNNFRF